MSYILTPQQSWGARQVVPRVDLAGKARLKHSVSFEATNPLKLEVLRDALNRLNAPDNAVIEIVADLSKDTVNVRARWTADA